jgi:hypothetical protein
MVRDRQIFHAELNTEMGAGALFTSLIKHLPDLELLAEFDLPKDLCEGPIKENDANGE